MSDRSRAVYLTSKIEAAASVACTASVTNGHTGRTVTCDLEYGQVREWACLPSDKIPLHPFAERVRAAIPNAQCVKDNELLCCRGQSLKRDSRPTSDRLGPPPVGRPCPENRYNRADEGVLYCCTSEGGVAREVTIGAGNELYLQAYKIPLQQLRIADFTDAALDPLLNGVFEIAESCMVEGRGPDSYDFSQFVAELVAGSFDGMMVPGVRGDRALRYSSVVIFRPHPRWREWVIGEPEVVRLFPEPTSE
jgi:hypothetical protein